MNVVGKILIGLITFTSVLFMAISLAVYSAHQSWKTKANALKEQVTKESQELNNLKGQRDRLAADLAAEQRSLHARFVTLDAEQKNLEQDLAANRKVLAASQGDLQKVVDAMQVTQKTMADTDAQLKELRQAKQSTDEEREKEFGKAVLLTDQLHQAANEFNAVRTTNNTLIQDLQKYK